MENKKFVVTPRHFQGDTRIISSRLPTEMVSELDLIAKESGRTRNEVIQLSLEFAMNNLEIENEE